MFRFAICNEMYGNQPLEAVCADVVEAGYKGLEIAPFTLDEDPRRITETEAERIGRTIRSFGLEVVGLHWLLAQPAGLHLTTRDATVRQTTTDFLCHLARLCGALGGAVMVLGSPEQRSVIDGENYDDAFARAVEVCRTVCQAAEPVGVKLAMEPLSRNVSNFLNTAEETIRFIQAIDHPAAALHLDVNAMCDEAKPIAKIIEESAEHLVHFHANDPNLLGPGMGEVDFEPIFAALEKVGYDGFVSVEVFDFKPGAPQIARQSLGYIWTFAKR